MMNNQSSRKDSNDRKGMQNMSVDKAHQSTQKKISSSTAPSIWPTLSQLSERIEIKVFDGSAGTNRAEQSLCQIKAHNDFEAVFCFLHEYSHKPSTYRTYQKEVERFLLWCLYQHQKSLSSLDRDDFEAYFHFLDNPQTKITLVWISGWKRATKRAS